MTTFAIPLQIFFSVAKNFLDCCITNRFACRFGANINADYPDAFTANCNDVTSFVFLFDRGRMVFVRNIHGALLLFVFSREQVRPLYGGMTR